MNPEEERYAIMEAFKIIPQRECKKLDDCLYKVFYQSSDQDYVKNICEMYPDSCANNLADGVGMNG